MPDKFRDEGYRKAKQQLDEISQLVTEGVLGDELMPEPTYCSWPILQLDRVPAWLLANHDSTEIVRWPTN
jgi:hypothetical protein